MQNLRNRSFLTLLDFSQKELSFTKSIEDLKREIRRYRTAKLKGKTSH